MRVHINGFGKSNSRGRGRRVLGWNSSDCPYKYAIILHLPQVRYAFNTYMALTFYLLDGLTPFWPCLWHLRLLGDSDSDRDSKLTFERRRCRLWQSSNDVWHGANHISFYVTYLFVDSYMYLFIFMRIICIWHIFMVLAKRTDRNQNMIFAFMLVCTQHINISTSRRNGLKYE